MKERPILFSAPMVRAILEGRKTQTRRVIKARVTGPNPPKDYFDFYDLKTNKWIGALGRAASGKREFSIPCPYGKTGDRLWVRESFFHTFEMRIPKQELAGFDDGTVKLLAADGTIITSNPKEPHYQYGSAWKRKPAIHMPRWASRILLEITEVRVQRLQEIGEEDAKAEGIRVLPLQSENDPSAWYQSSPGVHQERSAKASFSDLWNSINAKRGHGWDTNPWVWAISFKQVRA